LRAGAAPVIVWLDGAHDAAENMRRDALLLAAFDGAADGVMPCAVLRLYRFDPPGITLGASQRPERELDLDACRADGIAWAVRPTGGRAVFHDEEWTYALACAIADPVWGGTLREAYARGSALVAGSLARLGIPAALAAGRRAEAGRESRVAAPCFASTARHEVVLGGRKLVGSAQRRTARSILQQGSVLLGSSHVRLADYVKDPGARVAVRALLSAGAGHPEARWRRAPLADWAAALLEACAGHATLLTGNAGHHLLTGRRSGPYAAANDSTGIDAHVP
jgi:lipoate-protein ligase A